MTTTEPAATVAPTGAVPQRLPVPALVLLALTGFIVIMTETLPAGLLTQLAGDLSITEGAAGQLVTVYALGTVIAAIPAITLTRGVARKPLLIIGLAGFLVANTVTAIAPSLAWALVVRFVGGAFAGLLWGMLAGYARRISPSEQSGRALAIALTGTPVALAIGTPLGTFLGASLGWRWAFAAISVLTALVILAALVLVPNAPGQGVGGRLPLRRVAAIPGVATILLVVFGWLMAHNVLYTYIAPFLASAGDHIRADVALLIFGVAALLGIWATGALVDRALRRLALVSLALFAVAGAVLFVAAPSPVALVAAIVLWGATFGGAATQLQTAMGEAAGENADVAIALLTTSFNLAIFGGGAVGALIVDGAGAAWLPVAMIALAVVAFVGVLAGRRSAFPVGR